jgi:hypothetical protein
MSFLNAVYGTKPKVPVWNNITLPQEQSAAISQNASSLPSNEALASGVDTFNQNQLTTMLNSIIPNFTGSSNQLGLNINNELQGKLPADVQSQLQESDAAQALTGGFGGSGLAGNLTARDLGISSLNLMQTGQSELENWSSQIDQMFAPGEFNVSSMFVDPQQEFQDTFQNQSMQWGQQWLASQVSAMPKPQAAGLEKAISGLGTSVLGAI